MDGYLKLYLLAIAFRLARRRERTLFFEVPQRRVCKTGREARRGTVSGMVLSIHHTRLKKAQAPQEINGAGELIIFLGTLLRGRSFSEF
jgi:hypothetical protein